jgi:hypothetical protein
VNFGDKMSKTDWELLSKCCSPDGRILKPSAAIGLTNIDLHGNGEQNTGTKDATGARRWQTYVKMPIGTYTNNICEASDYLVNNILMTYNLLQTFSLPTSNLEESKSQEIYLKTYPYVSPCIKIESGVVQIQPNASMQIFQTMQS